MQPYPPRRARPRPNYTLRRLVAATVLVLVVVGLWRLGAAVTGDDGSAAEVTTTTRPPTTTVPLVAAPPCEARERSEPTAYARPEDWFRTLLDTTYAVPEQYVPPDLVSASEAGYSADFQVRAIVVDDLARMRNAVLEAGVPEVALLAAYRSLADQQVLYESRVAEMGADAAAEGTARAGHSEHHLGTAIDVRPIGQSDVDQSFGATPTGRWLADNSWRFGFVLSYPEGAEDVTCYKYEPWHLRYVGVDLAGRVHASGLALREYLWHWQVSGKEPGVSPSSPPPPVPSSPGDTGAETGG